MLHGAVVVMKEGVVDFGRYPPAAVTEVATKHTIHAFDRLITVSKIRMRLLLLDGDALTNLLRDLHDAAVRHGADDVVELTADN
jgi:hypothetical protein